MKLNWSGALLRFCRGEDQPRHGTIFWEHIARAAYEKYLESLSRTPRWELGPLRWDQLDAWTKAAWVEVVKYSARSVVHGLVT